MMMMIIINEISRKKVENLMDQTKLWIHCINVCVCVCRQSKPPPPLSFTIQGLEMQIAHMFTYISSLFSTEKKI